MAIEEFKQKYPYLFEAPFFLRHAIANQWFKEFKAVNVFEFGGGFTSFKDYINSRDPSYFAIENVDPMGGDYASVHDLNTQHPDWRDSGSYGVLMLGVFEKIGPDLYEILKYIDKSKVTIIEQPTEYKLGHSVFNKIVTESVLKCNKEVKYDIILDLSKCTSSHYCTRRMICLA
jgi:hypothetical protein